MIERAHDVDSAVQLIKDVQFIHRHANFELRNLTSNNSQVLEAINGSPEFDDKILVDNMNISSLMLVWRHTLQLHIFESKTEPASIVALLELNHELHPTSQYRFHVWNYKAQFLAIALLKAFWKVILV